MSNPTPRDEHQPIMVDLQVEPNVRLSTKQFDQIVNLFDRFVFGQDGRAIQLHMMWARFQNGDKISLRAFYHMGASLELYIKELKLPCQINLRDE